jgi:hypothetical protein
MTQPWQLTGFSSGLDRLSNIGTQKLAIEILSDGHSFSASAMNGLLTIDQTVTFSFKPSAMHCRTLSSPTRISPASTTEQKQHQQNNQYSFHRLTAVV